MSQDWNASRFTNHRYGFRRRKAILFHISRGALGQIAFKSLLKIRDVTLVEHNPGKMRPADLPPPAACSTSAMVILQPRSFSLSIILGCACDGFLARRIAESKAAEIDNPQNSQNVHGSEFEFGADLHSRNNFQG
jgi:hypothetical protein